MTLTTPVDVAIGNGNVAGVGLSNVNNRPRLVPNRDHKADNYDDLGMEFSPLFLSSLERFLPPDVLDAPRYRKYKYMREVLRHYSTAEEPNRVQKHNEYKKKIVSDYKPLYKEPSYTMDPSMFFVKSFSKAFQVPDNFKDRCIRSMMQESAPGVYTFNMLQPSFCDRLLREVDYFEKWACETRFRIMRPSTMHRFGVALDDIGMKSTLDWLMRDFICHIAKILFPDVGGCSLDSNHGYVVEYGMGRDVDLGFHVDDSEVTLNVCLGTEFTDGDLFFGGVRCEKHMNTKVHSEEIFSCSHTRGTAIIHRGFHRHGAFATTSGNRFNLVMWCRSAAFREMKKHRKGFSDNCGECKRERQARVLQSVAARKKKLLGVVGEGDDAS